jgi:DNA-binding NarL/FixJ family response regulator
MTIHAEEQAMTDTSIRMLIADDHPVVRDGLHRVLEPVPALCIVGSAESFHEVQTMLADQAADVLILDLGGMGGSPLSLMNYLRQRYPDLAVIVFSSGMEFAPELLQAGVKGYVTKDELSHALTTAVTEVIRGEVFLSPVVRQYLEQRKDDPADLSSKELETLKLLAQGLSTVAIADHMGIDPRTVQNYITKMYQKTCCSQRTQLVDWYRRVYGVPAS